METIINKVAESGIITLNLEDLLRRALAHTVTAASAMGPIDPPGSTVEDW
jgi:hypothetical protein